MPPLTSAGHSDVSRRAFAKVGGGFVVAAILLYLLGRVVGWGEIARALGRADPLWLVLAMASTTAGLVAWTRVWDDVLSALAVDVPLPSLAVTYFGATFADYVTPQPSDRLIPSGDERPTVRLRDLAMPALTGLVVATFALGFLGVLPTFLPGVDARLLVLVPTAVFLLVTAVVYRKRHGRDRTDADRSVWDAIPNWQYTGRHVEAGGITVDEQERALRDVQEQAETREGGR